jgi:hypothetical protein
MFRKYHGSHAKLASTIPVVNKSIILFEHGIEHRYRTASSINKDGNSTLYVVPCDMKTIREHASRNRSESRLVLFIVSQFLAYQSLEEESVGSIRQYLVQCQCVAKALVLLGG